MAAFTHTGDGNYRHRPWWKVAINTVLRFVQRTNRPYLIVSIVDVNESGYPIRLVGYRFQTMRLIKNDT